MKAKGKFIKRKERLIKKLFKIPVKAICEIVEGEEYIIEIS